jgi:hypothetical protein
MLQSEQIHQLYFGRHDVNTGNQHVSLQVWQNNTNEYYSQYPKRLESPLALQLATPHIRLTQHLQDSTYSDL